MNIDELRGMSQDEQFKAAAKYAGVREQTLRNMWKVESTNGKNLRGPETQWGIAKGHFQVLDAPRKTLEKRFGREFNPDDFTDSIFMASEMLRENKAKFGNEGDAVRAYHGGWNKKNWGKVNAQYHKDVMGDAPEWEPPKALTAVDLFSKQQGQADRVPGAVLWYEKQTPNTQTKDGTEGWIKFDREGSSNGVRDNPGRLMAGFNEARLREAERFRQDTTFGDIIGYSYRESMRPIFRIVQSMGLDQGVDQAFLDNLAKNGPAIMKDMSMSEQAELLSVNNAEQYSNMLHSIGERRNNQKVIAQGNTATQIAAGVIAEMGNPINYLAGGAVSMVARGAGVGAYALAKNGRTVTALSSAVVEGAVGNVVTEGVIQAIGETRTAEDYLVAGAMGFLPAALQAPGLMRAQAVEHVRNQAKAAQDLKAKAAIEASIELGPDADPHVVAQRASEMAARWTEDATSLKDRPSTPVRRWADEDEDFEAGSSYQQTRLALRRDPDNPELLAQMDKILADADRRALPDMQTQANAATLTGMPGAELGVTPIKGFDNPDIVVDSAANLAQTNRYHDGRLEIPEDAKAIFDPYTGKVSLLADRLTPDEVKNPAGLIAHEVGVHYGLEKTVGSDVFDRIIRSIEKSTDGRALAARNAVPEDTPAFLRGEEMLGYLAEHHPDSTWVQRLVGDVRNWLRKYLMPGLNVTVNDALQYIRGATDRARRGVIRVATGRTRGTSNTEANFGVFSNEGLDMDLRFSRGSKKNHTPSKPTPSAKAPKTKETVKAARDLQQPDPKDAARGLDMYPVSTDEEAIRKRLLARIHDTADEWAAVNQVDPERLKSMAKTALYDIRTPGLIMAASENNIMRWVSGTLVEVTTGASGTKATAALAKHSLKIEFMQDVMQQVDANYQLWSNAKAGGLSKATVNNFTTFSLRQEFMRDLSLYRNSVYYGRPDPDVHPTIKAAAEALDESYARSLGTARNDRLPNFDIPIKPGYMSHKLNANVVTAMTVDEQRALRDVFKQQFMQLNGMDEQFAQYVGDRYLAHARSEAAGTQPIPGNIFQPEALGWVIDALRKEGVPEDRLLQLSKAIPNARIKQSKSRLEVDLSTPVGDKQLVDFFVQDQNELVRNYSDMMAGQIALHRWGVPGEDGLNMIKEAMNYGGKTTKAERKAFDQVSSELLGKPYGEVTAPFWEGVMTMNAAANLGLTVFPQAAEGIKMALGMGIANTIRHIPTFAQMIREVRALARGEKVDNPIIGTIELPGGSGPLGLEDYHLVTKYDSQSSVELAGGEVGPILRATRVIGKHLGTLNLTRIVSAAQRRTVAAQTTSQVLRAAANSGTNVGAANITLARMGFDQDFLDRLAPHIEESTVFNSDGWVKSFDIRKLPLELREEMALKVLRGTRQVIQGEFIGERAGYRYTTMGKIMSQFRSYGLLSMEKQYAADRAAFGALRTWGMAIAMSGMAMPLYITRTYLQAMGRDEEAREEYLDQAFSPLGLAKGLLNYVAWAGMASELMDGLSSAVSTVDRMAGGAGLNEALLGTARGSTGGSAVDALFPGAAWVSSVGKTVANPSTYGTLKVMPYNGLPYLQAVVNASRDTD